jgi:hypothetical protein
MQRLSVPSEARNFLENNGVKTFHCSHLYCINLVFYGKEIDNVTKYCMDIPTHITPSITTTARIKICVCLCVSFLKKGFQKSSSTTAAIELRPVESELKTKWNIKFLLIEYFIGAYNNVQSTARHAIHLQFDISASSLEIKLV